jgi:bifunctional UDP-N-acetylglucosamine pyrophosphorylase / glucosamine-1-phosphate N-acetyltransferase
LKDEAVQKIATIILAAGKGTRMKSDRVKVLHPLLGVPMLSYSIELALTGIRADRTIVVAGHQADRIQRAFGDSPVVFALQEEQLGTGHAVLQAVALLKHFPGTVLILCGDVPLVKAETVRSFIDDFHAGKSSLSVMTTVVQNPFGYGRIVRSPKGWVKAIVEEKDATGKERRIREINTGLYCVDASFLKEGLKEIGRDNAQGEYYLTDLVTIAGKRRLKCTAFPVSDPIEVMGINTRVDLAVAEETLRQEKLKALMLSGVTLIDPKVTYVEKGVEIGRETVLYPNAILQGKTTIGERCLIESNTLLFDSAIGNDVKIRASSVIEESRIEDGATIGPFAHLRPGTVVKTKAKIGNFVEVKKSVIGRGSKANHLTYIGDSIVGEEVNIGAGTITCNYDGIHKHQTVIEDGVFVGSNVELVAPVHVGKNASIGAGTTVTKNVPEGALAISRMHQQNIPGWDERVKLRREQQKGKN